MHRVPPGADTWPSSHATHAVAPAASAYQPLAHGTQGAMLPAAYVPAAHAVHAVAPSFGATVPAGHGSQLLLLTPAHPGGHGTHNCCCAASTEPGMQLQFVAPEGDQAQPPHAAQPVCPGSPAYVPAAHALHVAVPRAEA